MPPGISWRQVRVEAVSSPKATQDVRKALERLLRDDRHLPGCPKFSTVTVEFACSCGLNEAHAIARAAVEDPNWHIVRNMMFLGAVK